nr:MAG TPA: hypothetical protein [Caudoviricetes sp.]
MPSFYPPVKHPPRSLPCQPALSPVPILGPNPDPKRDPHHAQHIPTTDPNPLTKLRYT